MRYILQRCAMKHKGSSPDQLSSRFERKFLFFGGTRVQYDVATGAGLRLRRLDCVVLVKLDQILDSRMHLRR